MFCVLSSAHGWAGAAVCIKLILWHALLEVDAALAIAAGLLGATAGFVTLRGRASWVKAMLWHGMVGVLVGAGVLAYALAARGLVTSACVRFWPATVRSAGRCWGFSWESPGVTSPSSPETRLPPPMHDVETPAPPPWCG